jgi:hypothetical protein
MKTSRTTPWLSAGTLLLVATLTGCVELSRSEKMTTFTGSGKAGRTIPGHQSQEVPKQQEFPSK